MEVVLVALILPLVANPVVVRDAIIVTTLGRAYYVNGSINRIQLDIGARPAT
jgi:hypothetical protein